MTRPVQIAFVYENERPKVFLRTLLYATGIREYVIEGLYVKLRRGDENHTFGFWGYGERNELMAAGGLRIDEAGVAYNHHFLEINEGSHFHFTSGEHEIRVYAKIVNRSSDSRSVFLCTNCVQKGQFWNGFWQLRNADSALNGLANRPSFLIPLRTVDYATSVLPSNRLKGNDSQQSEWPMFSVEKGIFDYRNTPR